MAVDQSGVWRFRDLLPIVDDLDKVVTLREGNTPLYDLPRCAKIAGIDWLLAKHQGMNPTGSFKDTGMTAALSVAAERGFEWVACASTGNTSAAMAAYAARAGLRSIVFIPEGKIAWGKLSQSMDYGALTIQLRTDFDGCVRVLADLVTPVPDLPAQLRQSLPPRRPEDPRLRNSSSSWSGRFPSTSSCPAAISPTRSALGKGFHGDAPPRPHSARPEDQRHPGRGRQPALPQYSGNDGKRVMNPVKADTRATAIRIGNPASGRRLLRVIDGPAAAGASRSPSRRSLSPRPRSAPRASAASLPPPSRSPASRSSSHRARSGTEERVVLILTGHTLKDSDYTIHYHRNELFTDAETGPAHGRGTGPARCTAQAPDRSRCRHRRRLPRARVLHEADAARMSTPQAPLHLRLPATSANLGPGFDALGLAMALYLTIDATISTAGFSIDATGRDAEQCAVLENNLIFTTYIDVLANTRHSGPSSPSPPPQ